MTTIKLNKEELALLKSILFDRLTTRLVHGHSAVNPVETNLRIKVFLAQLGEGK